MKLRKCRWKCSRLTDRRAGICLECCRERDETNRRIDAGLEAYVPPERRVGHRFYERKQITASQRAHLANARALKVPKSSTQTPIGRTIGGLDEDLAR